MADSSLSLPAAAGKFLAAVREENVHGALALLRDYPALTATSLHASAAVCDAAAVRAKLAVDPGAAYRRMGPNDVPPICYAVQSSLRRALDVSEADQLDTLRLLLDAGADPNSTVPLPDVAAGIPILYFPCVANEVAVARLLLERGANPDDGESLYHAAEHDHRECLALLRDFGANLSGVHPEYGNTPLHFLAAHTAGNPITPRTVRGMAWLLAHGADPNVRSHRSASGATLAGGSETPLIRAVASGHDADVLDLLVRHGADVNAARDDGRTAYVMAMRIGNISAAEYLRSAGAEVTPLQPVDALLHACAITDRSAAAAIVASHPSLLTSLAVDDRRAMVRAVQDGAQERLEVMLAVGFPVDEQDEWGGTPLHVAAWHGRVSMVRVLLSHGAPVDVRDTRYGSSPLGWAAHGSRFCRAAPPEDYATITALLLDAGATWAMAVNQWREGPDAFADPAVMAVLRARGLVTAHPAG